MNIDDKAKTVICYGDSNTWGAIPGTDDERHPRSIRWPYTLQALLGSNYEVISEGLPGRTLVAHDPEKAHRTGITHLDSILRSADPVSLVVIMLGTNDVKKLYNLSAEDIAQHLSQTIELINAFDKDIEVLVVCPPSPNFGSSDSVEPRMVRGPEIFKTLPGLYRQVAQKYRVGFLDAGEHIASSKIDGYHLDADMHVKLAKSIKDHIISQLPQ